MIAVPAGVRVVVSAQPVDFRRGIDGLAALVQEHLKADVFAGDVYVFRCRRADRVKILVWEGSGLCLFHKRLEQGPGPRAQVNGLNPIPPTPGI